MSRVNVYIDGFNLFFEPTKEVNEVTEVFIRMSGLKTAGVSADPADLLDELANVIITAAVVAMIAVADASAGEAVTHLERASWDRHSASRCVTHSVAAGRAAPIVTYRAIVDQGNAVGGSDSDCSSQPGKDGLV